MLAVIATSIGDLPPLASYDLYRECTWTTRGHKWAFRVYWLKSALVHNNYKRDSELDKLNLVFRDGRVVKRFANEKDRPEWEPWGPYLAAQKVNVRSPYERVIAVRGAGGLGVHWDTTFYGFQMGTMTYIGRAPALNANGPLNWRASRSLWVFDDYDSYRQREGKGVTRHMVFRIDKGKAMRPVRSIPSHRSIRRVVWLKEIE